MSLSLLLIPAVLVIGGVLSASGLELWLNSGAKKQVAADAHPAKTTPKKQVKPQVFHSYPTNFKDAALLVKTLQDYGVSEIQQSKKGITGMVSGYTLRFYPDSTGVYQVEVPNDYNLKTLYQRLSSLDIEYKKNVQAFTYNNLKQKAAAENMTIENEEVLDDNSIVR